MSDEVSEQETAGADAPDEEPRPKRRKKRRPGATDAVETPEPPAQPVKEAAADEVPAFARAFPEDPALGKLVAAFEAGDFARVRREVPRLVQETESDEVRAAARELRRRLDPDPVAVYLLAIAAVLLVFLAGWYGMHVHGP